MVSANSRSGRFLFLRPYILCFSATALRSRRNALLTLIPNAQVNTFSIEITRVPIIDHPDNPTLRI